MLRVGVSLFDGSGTHRVNSVTDGGVSLTLVGAGRDSSNQVRSELWRLVAPASGAANVVVTLNSSSAGLNAGDITFTGVH